VWDLGEQEEVYDREVELGDFNPDTAHGCVAVLDMTVREHAHGEGYEFIGELSKAPSPRARVLSPSAISRLRASV
jgi:hypothetical protein